MKETNDKIVQEYIDRAREIASLIGIKFIPSNIIEIAKMIQLQDFMDKITTIKK